MDSRNIQRGGIIFDLDGTLVDSAPGILAAFGATLREAGIAPRVSLDASLIGPPLAETLMRLSGSNDAKLIGGLTGSRITLQSRLID